MKYQRLAFIVSALLAIALFAFLGMPNTGCTPVEEKAASSLTPALAPTTRAVEHVQQTLDPAAAQAKALADTTKAAADGATVIGVPGASTVAGAAGLIGGLLGLYLQRRNGTLPLSNALEEVVHSVEWAFPNKTPEQKAALAAAQGSATKNLVTRIKGT